MPELVPLVRAHLAMVNYRKGDESAPYYIERIFSLPQSDYIAYAGIEHNEVIGVGVIYRMWHGVADAVMALSNKATEKPFWFHRRVKEKIEEAKEVLNLHRIQSCVECNKLDRVKWMKSLGFKLEGIMRQYTPDRTDCYLYAWTREQ